jgi:hypothetical protein
MSANTTSENSQNSEAADKSENDPAKEIDLQALAEEIFRLLKKDLAIENERRGR